MKVFINIFYLFMMMNVLSLTGILSFSILREDFVNLSVLNKVEAKYGKSAANRLIALNELLKENMHVDVKTKLKKVNDFFNSVKYASDKRTYGITDYWANPYEMLARNRGDCEDYVLGKYLALEYLGVSTSKMFLTYVTLKKTKEAHMVLTYFETPKSEPLVLDNLKKTIQGASKRTDLVPVLSFNPSILKSKQNNTAHENWDAFIKRYEGEKI